MQGKWRMAATWPVLTGYYLEVEDHRELEREKLVFWRDSRCEV